MEISAQIKHLRIAPRKMRLAVNFIKGMDVTQAEHQLEFSKKSGAEPVLKLLRSAVANAEKNHDFQKSNLFVKNVVLNDGSVLKRFQPRAFGRASVLRKRSTHVRVVLAEKKPTQPKKAETKPGEKPVAQTDVKKPAQAKKSKTGTKK
ncbi:MAG: 50S ribosomal protein L22 [bacterium]|nr:50S ribosomal protein L22 [bacterium]